MTTESFTGPPEILHHNLNEHFSELLRFESTAEMEASDLWREIGSEVERILTAVAVSEPSAVAGASVGTRSLLSANGKRASTSLADGEDADKSVRDPTNADGYDIRALAWNLERGIKLDGIIEALATHEDLKGKDILLLSELDHGMARSGNRFIAKEIAEALQMHYAFAPVYIPLQKGSGVEAEMEGENTLSIHGLGMFSRYSMRNVHAVPLPNGKDKMWGKEKRLGWLRVLIADIDHPAGTFRAVTVHLDVHCSREHRRRQMEIILDHLDTLEPLPTLIGGDWNTTTFNAQTARHAILGYWRRVMMGVHNVAKNHFPHPDRYFERGLFAEVESHGYEYKPFNELGVGTLHYHIESIEKNTNLRDWVPEWCFKFIFWAARRVGGGVSVRLDWFAARGLRLASGSSPKTVAGLTDTDGSPLSDHDAITVDLQF